MGTPKLVWTHACQTAEFERRSIAYAFILNGCPEVIGSLWNVDDDTAADIASQFYEYYWSENNSIHGALRKLRLDLITARFQSTSGRHPHGKRPYYWAIYDYFSKKYDKYNPPALQEGEAYVNFFLKTDTIYTKIKIKDGKDTTMKLGHKRNMVAFANSIESKLHGKTTPTKAYSIFWHPFDDILVEHNIKKVYISIHNDVRGVKSGLQPIAMFDSHTNKYLVERYDIIVLH